MVDKSMYYAVQNSLDYPLLAPVDGVLIGPHAAAILAIPDNDPGFVAWKAAKYTKQLDEACRAHIDQRAHWTAGPMIWDKAAKLKPKSKAVKEWSEACWLQYYTNKAKLEAGVPFDEAMAVYPESPYSMAEVMGE